MNWLFLVGAILAEVVATSALKASDGFTRPLPVAILACGYGVAFYWLSQALRTIPVAIAYAIWSGAGIVLVALIGRLAFGQRLDAQSLAGMGLVIAGVVIMQARV
jgi:small multidrug resistance pump